VAGAAVAAVSLGGLVGGGVVSADAASGSTNSSSIVEKIASKFNLSKDEVATVFKEDRAARQAERETNQAERLATAVSDGSLTQAQADYITTVRAEIKMLIESASSGSDNDTTREQIKTKMDALRTWANDNNVDKKYLGGGHHGGPKGEARGNKPSSNTTSDGN
jgi:hypothetical protein